ncbi:MAG: tetratricopeptide repeat protein [Bacteroidetes bacterium]|nr:tetratricopeptide repeat protein [Bacteroidota bacterium]
MQPFVSVKKIFLVTFILITCTLQSINIDSLKQFINKASRDTQQVNAMNILCNQLFHTNAGEGYLLAHKARALAARLNFVRGLGEANQAIAVYFNFNGGDSALYYLQKAKANFTKINDELRIGSVNVSMGTYYETINEFEKSLNYYLEALKVFEKHKIDKAIASACLGLGNVFYNLKNYNKAIEYSRKSMEHFQKINSPYASWAMNNMANAYEELGDLKTAVTLYEKSLALKLESKDYYGAVFSIDNLGNIFLKEGDLRKALTYFERSLALCRQKKMERETFANSFKNLSEIYISLEDYPCAKKNLDSLHACIAVLNFGELQTDYLHKMSRYLEGTGRYKEACEYKDRYIKTKDSLFTSEVNRIVNDADAKYTAEKKQKEIELLNKDKKISLLQLEENQAQLNKQRVIIFSSAGAAVLLILLVFMLINRNKLKQKSNEKLSAFNLQLHTQKALIEEKQKEILDSIRYAKRIQQSLLTSEMYIHKHLNKLRK